MKPKDDEKQRAIAQATFELVAQTGLSGLTLADIARAAGIATSTLYVYYPSKDELISQLYQDAKTVTAAPIPLLTASLVGTVRETGTRIRTEVLPDEEAVHQMAFGLCWDALKG